MIGRRKPLYAKVGVFGVGHAVYWDQFPGLYEKLMEYHADMVSIVRGTGVDIIDLGMIDSSIASYEAQRKLNAEGVDVIFCNMLTYATSSVFAPVIRDANAPVVLTALQPLSHMDYTNASTRQQLENDCICSVPEFTGVAIRMGRRVADVVIGKLYGDSRAAVENNRPPLIPQIRSAAADVLDDLRVQFARQKRQDHMPHLVPQDGRIGVGGILPPSDAARPQIVSEIFAPYIEERTDEHDVFDETHRLESGQPRRARRPLQPHQESLRHIVHLVPRRDAVEMQMLHGRSEELESLPPRRHLDRFPLPPRHLDPRRMERQTEPRGQTFDERRIVRRLLSDPVIEMQHHCLEPVRGAQRRHQHEKRNGVGAAGNGQSNPHRLSAGVRQGLPQR